MTQKSISQSGLSMIEASTAVFIIAAIVIALCYFGTRSWQNAKIDRTLYGIYVMRQDVPKVNAGKEWISVIPLLMQRSNVPSSFILDENSGLFKTPTGNLLDVKIRGTYTAFYLYDMSYRHCLRIGQEVLDGGYFSLGQPGMGLELLKINETDFMDLSPPTKDTLKQACDQDGPVDLLLAFR